MPELPEVETVRVGLVSHVIGRTITGVEVLRDYSIRHQIGGVAGLSELTQSASIIEVARRGKFMWLVLDCGGDDRAGLLVHLGMSGQLRVHHDPLTAPSFHTRVRLRLDGVRDGEDENPTDDDHAPILLDFVDQRTFGYVAATPLVPTDDGGRGGAGTELGLVPDRVQHIARDLLDPDFSMADTVARISAKRSGIKRVLLDQRTVSGIGNIYADEALWQAAVHGEHPADQLSARQITAVLEASRDVMSAALAQGGTSFDALYVNVNGESGYFSRSLEVYGRAGEPCRRCGTAIVRAPFANRSSYYCPRCQRTHRSGDL